MSACRSPILWDRRFVICECNSFVSIISLCLVSLAVRRWHLRAVCVRATYQYHRATASLLIQNAHTFNHSHTLTQTYWTIFICRMHSCVCLSMCASVAVFSTFDSRNEQYFIHHFNLSLVYTCREIAVDSPCFIYPSLAECVRVSVLWHMKSNISHIQLR